jgi:divalent metal cation (Fe/Co/Zn/Cd) transporter
MNSSTDLPIHGSEPPNLNLLRRGLRLEYVTLGWNVVGVVLLAFAAVAARSVALAGFGLDSLIEIFASMVVVWELAGTSTLEREQKALRMIGTAFFALALYIALQGSIVLAAGDRPHTSVLGIAWTAITCAVMLALAAGKSRTGTVLGNPVLTTEGRVTLIDAYLAGAVLLGLVFNAALHWWWADPLAGFVIVFYGIKEGFAAWSSTAN